MGAKQVQGRDRVWTHQCRGGRLSPGSMVQEVMVLVALVEVAVYRKAVAPGCRNDPEGSDGQKQFDEILKRSSCKDKLHPGLFVPANRVEIEACRGAWFLLSRC